MKIFKKLTYLFTIQETKKVFFILAIILITALLDMIGVASILPFIAVLSNPDIIETNLILNYFFKTSSIFGIENNKQFLILLGSAVFAMLILSLTFKALSTYLQIRFLQMCEYNISKRLIEGYLHQPYSWFLDRNSADLGKNILSETGVLVSSFLSPLIEAIAQATIIIALITLLMLVDLKLALLVVLILGGIYFSIFIFLRNYLNQMGNDRFEQNHVRFQSIGEAFNAIKEVKVAGLEKFYVELFSNSAKIYAHASAASVLASRLPRYFIEAIAFGGIMLIIIYLLAQTGSFANSLPMISLYVFAGYRMMPAIQQFYSAISKLVFIGSSLDKLYEDIKSLKPQNLNQNQGVLSFDKKICLKNIYYSYPNASRTALKNICLNIPAKSTVALVGATGCGKTTTADIILGILEAQKGFLEVDGVIITKQNTRSWQKSIGYVPQHIFLADNTIASNIAFGVKTKNINQAMVEKVSKIANIHNFIIEELPKKYETKIGERGVRLSGGQRQRIGIARALYHNPKLLILDEATSALDNQTEKIVIKNINNLSKDITIILITHRLNTVINCDTIFLLEKGELKNQGSFQELIKVNENFLKSATNL